MTRRVPITLILNGTANCPDPPSPPPPPPPPAGVEQGIPHPPNANRSWGDASGANRANAGLRFTANLSGPIQSVTIGFTSASQQSTVRVELWTDNGTSPGSQLAVSEATTISSAGDYEFTLASAPDLVDGTPYWMVLADVGGTFSGGLKTYEPALAEFGSGNHDTISSITDTGPNGNNGEWWMSILAQAS